MFYLICFGLGLAFTAVSLMGVFHHQVHFGLLRGIHIGHGHAHGVGNSGISPVNGFTLSAFLCWFGGAGYLLQRYGGFVAPAILLPCDAQRAGRRGC